jgi:hypothetical protein
MGPRILISIRFVHSIRLRINYSKNPPVSMRLHIVSYMGELLCGASGAAGVSVRDVRFAHLQELMI